MSVAAAEDTIRLRGDCRVEDAEPLLALLHSHPEWTVDLSEARNLHTALVQILLAFRPRLKRPADDPFVEKFLVPLIVGAPTGEGLAND